MGEILMINGSPRAPRSNSRQYAQLFAQVSPWHTRYVELTRGNHLEVCRMADEASDVLLVFPLYADGLPVTMLSFLKDWEAYGPRRKPTVSVLINCGFLEPEQNDVAVEMVELFCKQNGLPFGCVLKIGGGEAILNTPFRGLVRGGVKKLARAMAARRRQTFRVTMPLPKRLYLKASTRYWIAYGQRNGVTREQMAALEIEPGADRDK